jgi:hypothetical protein
MARIRSACRQTLIQSKSLRFLHNNLTYISIYIIQISKIYIGLACPYLNRSRRVFSSTYGDNRNLNFSNLEPQTRITRRLNIRYKSYVSILCSLPIIKYKTLSTYFLIKRFSADSNFTCAAFNL